LKPRMVDNRRVRKSQANKFAGEALFDVVHLIKDIKEDEKTYLIFEV